MELNFTAFSAESDCLRLYRVYYVCAAQSCMDICSALLRTQKSQIKVPYQEP